ncbi:DUF559 domain-containing protein [Pseudonocardiaceae bacterium YIM PH 21723]|nr:DUF559 domain-containing protein [Pseudonocardiaceae bacterium YIM PH 21723]
METAPAVIHRSWEVVLRHTRRLHPGRMLTTIPEVFIGSELVEAGLLGRGQLRSSEFRRLIHGVYCRADLPRSHELKCRAMALVAPPEAVLTGRSAATIRGADLAKESDRVQMIVTKHRPSIRRDSEAWSVRIHDSECEPWNQIRIATPERTAFDLLRRKPLRMAIADTDVLVRTGVTSKTTIERYLQDCEHLGSGHARYALGLVDPRAESRPESELRVVFWVAGLRPIPQWNLWHNGVFVGRIDLAFPEERLAVEYEGAWHGEPMQFRSDERRRDAIRAAGWTVLVITAEQLYQSPETIVPVVQSLLS